MGTELGEPMPLTAVTTTSASNDENRKWIYIELDPTAIGPGIARSMYRWSAPAHRRCRMLTAALKDVPIRLRLTCPAGLPRAEAPG